MADEPDWDALIERAEWGPVITAAYPGDCASCGYHWDDGEPIRADGEGGWLCEDCGEDDHL